MAPEYGATMGFFPVDEETLKYLRLTGRSEEQIALVEAYTKAQGLFRTDATPDPVYSDTLELDLSTVEPSLAGPRNAEHLLRLEVRGERVDLVGGATRRAQVFDRRLVDREEAHRRAVFGRHVGDRRAVRHLSLIHI